MCWCRPGARGGGRLFAGRAPLVDLLSWGQTAAVAGSPVVSWQLFVSALPPPLWLVVFWFTGLSEGE